MCGSRIAQSGEPGGQLPSDRPVAASAEPAVEAAPAPAATPAAPVQRSPTLQGAPNPYGTTGAGGGPSLMDVSLASIGVRSNKKGLAVVAVVSLVLVGAGAGVSYWLTGGEAEVAPSGSAEATDPFVIGTPLPEGSDEPQAEVSGEDTPGADVPADPPPSGGHPEPRSGSGRAHQHPGMQPVTMHSTGGGSSMHASSGGAGHAGTMSAATMGSTMHDPAGSTGTGWAGSAGTGTSGTAMNSGTGGAGTGTGSAGAGTGSAGAGTAGGGADSAGAGNNTVPDLPTDAPEERDIELDMYGARVRFVVRRYYAVRARNCFDRATRNNPGVSGTVIVNMTISAAGQVSRTSVSRNTTGDATLGACLAGQVRQWRLPPPPGGELQMQMPFSR